MDYCLNILDYFLEEMENPKWKYTPHVIFHFKYKNKFNIDISIIRNKNVCIESHLGKFIFNGVDVVNSCTDVLTNFIFLCNTKILSDIVIKSGNVEDVKSVINDNRNLLATECDINQVSYKSVILEYCGNHSVIAL